MFNGDLELKTVFYFLKKALKLFLNNLSKKLCHVRRKHDFMFLNLAFFLQIDLNYN